LAVHDIEGDAQAVDDGLGHAVFIEGRGRQGGRPRQGRGFGHAGYTRLLGIISESKTTMRSAKRRRSPSRTMRSWQTADRTISDDLSIRVCTKSRLWRVRTPAASLATMRGAVGKRR